ncbi:tRNA modification GTPase [Lacinutrix sp.]|uniref:tRNA modification GTPase n=1 Tax=Lacinutrix sp. TaxID=1937692 RepID=UPI0025C11C75|nr:tRNA modification GTPase [Lacinutrix sp.]
MKKPLLTILIAIISVNCFAQISFEKGYFIDNNDQKTECLIKNIDWVNNPTEFQYKAAEELEKKTNNILSVKEFGIYNESKYVRSTVNIDRSSSKLNELSTSRVPTFKEEKLFLKVLVAGKANLYQFRENALVRFFYSKDNSTAIKQLVFKNYKSSGDLIGENNLFRQQLFNDLKCNTVTIKDASRIKYEKDDLTAFFVTYNECNNSELTNFEENKNRDLFNLTARIGFNNSSLLISNPITDPQIVDFGSKLNLRIGLEAEFILPWNKNKFAVILEPTYQNFKSEETVSNKAVIIDYSSIEIPLGIRYSSFINDNSKVFINGSYILDITNNSTVVFDRDINLEITNSFNFGFGVGYKQNDKYSLELRYQTRRGLLNTFQFFGTDYKTISLIFGYTIL